MLLLFPFALSTTFEAFRRKFKSNDIIFATLSVLLIMSGVIIMLLGVGLTSPLLNNSTEKSVDSVNTIVYFDEQNVTDSKNTYSISSRNGNTSKISILNITTTFEQKSSINDFGMLGIVLGVVSLGISLMLSGIAYVISILNKYDNSKLRSRDNVIIAVIWIIFGILIIICGYSVSVTDLSSVIQVIGWLYLVLGLVYGCFNLLKIISEKTFKETVIIATNQLKNPNGSSHMMLTNPFSPWIFVFLGGFLMLCGGFLLHFDIGPLQTLLYSIGLAILLFGASQVANFKTNTILNERLDKIEKSIENLKK